MRIGLDGHMINVSSRERIRDALAGSVQGAIDSGRFQLVDRKGDIVNIDLHARKGMELRTERVELPRIWADLPQYRNLRERLFVTLPVQGLPNLHFQIMATLRDAGYLTVDFDAAEQFLDALQRTEKEDPAALKRGMVVIADPTGLDAICKNPEEFREKWLKPRYNILFHGLPSRATAYRAPKNDVFMCLLPAVNGYVPSGDPGMIEHVCHSIVRRAALDAEGKLYDQDNRQTAVEASEAMRHEIRPMLLREWTDAAVDFEPLWEQILGATLPDVIYDELCTSDLARFFPNLPRVLELVVKSRISLKKGQEWAEYEQLVAA